MTRLLLVRHCQSTGQSPESQLTDVGRDQAEALVPFLSGFDIDFVVSSPYRRALQTIEPFAKRQSLEVTEDNRLRERELASIDVPDWLEHLEHSSDDLEYRHPTGESGREAQQRGWQAIDEIIASGHRRPAIVAHGNLIALILRCAEPSIGFEFWRGLSNPDVYLITRDGVSGWETRRVWDPANSVAATDRLV